MRYLVTAQLKDGKAADLLDAIHNKTLGLGSVAGTEYLRNMAEARLLDNNKARWVEVCYCATPLEEEIPYWEEYFDLTDIKNAHAPSKCKDLNGEEAWACNDCDCTEKLEAHLAKQGASFYAVLVNQQEGK